MTTGRINQVSRFVASSDARPVSEERGNATVAARPGGAPLGSPPSRNEQGTHREVGALSAFHALASVVRGGPSSPRRRSDGSQLFIPPESTRFSRRKLPGRSRGPTGAQLRRGARATECRRDAPGERSLPW